MDATNGAEPVEVTFTPVLTTAAEEILDGVLTTPFSYVSTAGPKWRSAQERRQFVADDRRSHLLVRCGDDTVGAITWSAAGTPGFLRLDITSCRDAAWRPGLVQRAIAEAMALIRRGSEVKRVELLFATYNDVLLGYLTECDHFEIEGVLKDRFFLDGRYWPGVLCRADLSRFPAAARDAGAGRADLLELLRKKATEHLSAAREDMADGSH